MAKKIDRATQANMIEAAKRYAKADSSDPFAFNRAMTHIKNGIATPANREGAIAYYDAEEQTENRALFDTNGNEVPNSTYKATIFKNAVRP